MKFWYMRILWEESFLMNWVLYCNWTRLSSCRKFKKDLCLSVVIQGLHRFSNIDLNLGIMETCLAVTHTHTHTHTHTYPTHHTPHTNAYIETHTYLWTFYSAWYVHFGDITHKCFIFDIRRYTNITLLIHLDKHFI